MYKTTVIYIRKTYNSQQDHRQNYTVNVVQTHAAFKLISVLIWQNQTWGRKTETKDIFNRFNSSATAV